MKPSVRWKRVKAGFNPGLKNEDEHWGGLPASVHLLMTTSGLPVEVMLAPG